MLYPGRWGELTLPGYGAQGGPPRAGLTGSAQQVPTSPSRTSSIRRAGRNLSAAGSIQERIQELEKKFEKIAHEFLVNNS